MGEVGEKWDIVVCIIFCGSVFKWWNVVCVIVKIIEVFDFCFGCSFGRWLWNCIDLDFFVYFVVVIEVVCNWF